MTKEEKIKDLYSLKECLVENPIEGHKSLPITLIDYAIEALEQETVSKEAYDHEYFLRKEFELKIDELQRQLEEQAVKAESILDKIRAEIAELDVYYDNDYFSDNKDAMFKCNDVLQILDKYKAESKDEK